MKNAPAHLYGDAETYKTIVKANRPGFNFTHHTNRMRNKVYLGS